jgi:hypothetical protein
VGTRHNIRYTRELLAAAVAQAFSIAEVLRILHLRQAGGNYTHIARRIRDYGLDTSHFDGGRRYRAQIGVPAKQSASQLLIELPDLARRTPAFKLRRALLEIGRPLRCEGCGLSDEWLGRKLTLEIDHINGHHNDNRPENVRFLCPNCHSQTETFCSRNIGVSEEYAYYGAA